MNKKNRGQPVEVINPAGIAKDFYIGYRPEYWLYRIALLKEAHDQYDSFKILLTKKISIGSDDEYRKMLETEMHFLYFQMIEALFELILACINDDNRLLWLSMSLSSKRETLFYRDLSETIRKYSEHTWNDIGLNKRTEMEMPGGKKSIPVLQMIFYFCNESRMSVELRNRNLANIDKLLRAFARDYSNRDDYNAYKHGLRFIAGSAAISLNNNKAGRKESIGSNWAIKYIKLHKDERKGKRHIGVRVAIKGFDYERDFRCCVVIAHMISNIIETRRHSYLPELIGKEFQMYSFVDRETDLSVDDILRRKGGFLSFEIDT